MSPVTALLINAALTALPGIFATWQAAGGKFDTTGAVAAGGAVVAALNGIFHSISTTQAGPLAGKVGK